MKPLSYTIIAMGILMLNISMTPVHALVFSIEFFLVFNMLDRFGKNFVFLEILAVIAFTQWLLAPVLSERLGVPLDVSYPEYYKYAIPGTLLYVFFLTLPLWNRKKMDGLMSRIIENLESRFSNAVPTAIGLTIFGFICWTLQPYIPASLNYIFYFLANFSLIGICMMLFTDYRLKFIWILSAFGLLVVTTLLNGMIGTVLIWGILIGMLYTTKNPLRIPFPVKLGGLIIGIWFLAVMQATKTEYRTFTWDIERSEASSRITREIKQDPSLFYELLVENIKDPTRLLMPVNAVKLAARLNQGMLVSYTMDHVPMQQSYGMGEVTILNTLTAFVPRLLWPNKPIIGQQEYFKKYSGVTLGKFVSATLGPIGDAYADFGWWGIIFLSFYGAGIGFLFWAFVQNSVNDPALLLWFMVMYYGAMTVSEVAVAGYVNSVVKYLLFIWGVRLILRRIVGLNV